MEFKPDYRLLQRYSIGTIPINTKIHPVKLKELTKYSQEIKQLLKEYKIPPDHLDNFCLVSELITRFPEKYLNEVQAEQIKRFTQEKDLLEAIENDKLVSVKFEFLHGTVPINQKWFVSKIEDFVLKDFSDHEEGALKGFRLKKRRKAQRSWDMRTAKSLLKFLTEEKLISKKTTAYEFIHKFWAKLGRPWKYPEARKPGKDSPGHKEGEDIPLAEAPEYFKKALK